jgi:calpain-15
MSEQEAVTYFRTLNVCRVKDWNEIRIKGKFVRVQDAEQASILAVWSKSYYSFDITESKNKVFITIHQEDERIKGVDLRRPYLDIGIALLRRTLDGVELIDLKDFTNARQVELEANLDPGSYLIVPRTTGCTMSHPNHSDKHHKPERLLVTIFGNDTISRRVKTSTHEKTLSLLFDTTITDIFNKFDVRN